ncbi:MAG TPA: FhaA domain-containing protein [Blastocatellia bacterium]|nr:FhaA domain-containing protein [Blastocatellia bacterium]
MSVQKWFETLRKWIDGEEDFDEQGKPRPRSKWDDFLVAVAREIEETMQREMFTPPGGPTYVPREYVVFLSTEDDAQWQGEKREGLERGLHYVLSERARQLAGENEFQTKTFTVELRVDPALENGRFRVQHVWDSEAQKTMVKPRKRPDISEQPTKLLPEQADEEATIVRPRKPASPTVSVAVRRQSPDAEATTPDVRRFFKDEITIGRGARQVAVDLQLEGDMEVSRKHATLAKRGEGEFVITCHGANPILLDGGREIPAGESATVKPGDKIVICSYELEIQ